VGHSMGGAIALLYAGTYPEDVKRLVLADVAGILHRHALAEHADALVADATPTPVRGPVSLFTHAVKQTLRSSDRRLISADFTRDIMGNHPQASAALSLIKFNFGPATGAVEAPTLLLWGKEDNVAPMRTAKALLSRIEGADLTVFERSSHVPMATEPDAFVNTVHKHLQRAGFTPPTPFSETTKQRHGSCKDQVGVHFEGTYDTITIDHCGGVTLSHVTANAVTISASMVTIDDTIIDGGDIGMTATNSNIVMTGGRISGETALHADDVALDLAGVHLVGRMRAVSETSSASLLCSICKVDSPLMNDYVHDFVSIAPKNPLEKIAIK
jgi:hypothetical protein